MRARSLAFALLLLPGLALGCRAAEPAGATIVLQLPPSMPPETVRRLLAELAAGGARPVAEPSPARPQPAATTADLAAGIWSATRRAITALPALRAAPRRWVEAIAAEGGTARSALLFWLVALAGVVAAPAIGRLFRRLLDRRQTFVSKPGMAPRVRAGGVRFLFAFASLALFALLFWAVLLAVSAGRPILEETTDGLVWAALKWRLSIVLLLIVLSPRRADLRLLAIDDSDARVCFRWLAVYLTANPFNVFLVWLTERLGFAPATVFGAALVLGVAITGYKVAMFWVLRRPVGRAILAATSVPPGPLRRIVAGSWHWLFITLALGVFIAATIEFALGSGAWVASASAATQGIVVGMAVLWQVTQNSIERLFAGRGTDPQSALRGEWFRRVLRRRIDALLWIVGAAWLGAAWGLGIFDFTPGTFASRFARPAFEAAVVVVGAWVLWTALSALIDEKMPRAAAPGDDDETAAGSASRLGTLLPLLRNMLLIGLAIVAVIAALSTLGVNIGPLLAGLGVVGIAIGFGAQTLVRDVISGLFFLMEDAFRVGEYIDTGRLRGTVEGMSLRSVRLRHQNGQVHTVPFGQVQAVTNFSRDWAVVKFNLHLDPAADIETVRRTIKRVGEELLADPETGGEFIAPLKMQGVVDVLQNALVVRCKFTANPARPTYLQRRALHRLIEAFTAAEIRFAAPNISMQFASLSAA